MSTLDEIREEARVCRKWGGEKSDWLENPSVHTRYAGDQPTLERRREETSVMFRAAQRLDKYADILSEREGKAA